MVKQPKGITVRVLVEPGAESEDRTMSYVISALKSSLRNIRDGAAAVILYDDEGKIIGMDISGTPTPPLQDAVDELVKKLNGQPPLQQL